MVDVGRQARASAGRARHVSGRLWREATASRRSLPDFVIIGAQRAGTSSLYQWLSEQPNVAAAVKKEVHYFDKNYSKGERWYRSNFPPRRHGTITGEATPYMLFHPLAPERASRDLGSGVRFIVLLREPVERAVSQYWHEAKRGFEVETFERAVAMEEGRLDGADELIRRGQQSAAHQHHSYLARGAYAEQLRRWFAAVGRDRVLVLESEQMFLDPAVASEAATWLGLRGSAAPFPALNAVERPADLAPELAERLRRHFEPHNRDLFELLGSELWAT